MGPTDLAIAILVVLAGILASAAYGAISVSPADFRKARICFVLSAICVVGVAIVWGFTTIQPLWIRLIATGLIGAIAAAGLTEALRWLNRREWAAVTPPPSPDASNTVIQDANLTFECNLADLPSQCPLEGRIGSMRLSYSPGAENTAPIGLIVKHCRPGSGVDWFLDLKFPQVYRCEITNYGAAPLLQVTLKFNIQFREALPGDPKTTTSRAGDAVYSHEWLILFAKIDPGKVNAATFYVYNESRFFAFVSPPRTASYIPLGKTAVREAAVSPIDMTAGMSLFPLEPAN
jgi:hypothetical protein